MNICCLNRDHYYLAGLVVFACLLFLPALGARDLWAPVEPRYAEIARMMFLKNEWIVPTVNGHLYTDKPILFFWIVLAAAKLTGAVTEWTVRLPAALGGIGFLVSTYFLGRDFFSPRIGAIAGLAVATSARVIWESRWAHVDMLFGCFFLLALYFGARALLRRGSPSEILPAYVFVALATLTKGLIGIVLPALVFASLMVARRDWQMIKAAKLHWGIPLFLLIAGPWFYLVNQATGGTWLRDFIFIHHIDRYTAGEGHEQPFFYYFGTLPADFLPWTALAVPALVKRRDYRRVWSEPDTQFFVLWFVSVFVFFTLSNTKRDLYLIPVLPTLALLVANHIDTWQTAKSSGGPLEFFPAVFFGIVALCGIVAPIGAWVWRPDMLAAVLPASIVLAGGGALSTIYVMRWRLAAVLAVSAMMLLLTLASAYWLLPYIEQFKSHRAFSAQVRRMVSPSAPLYVFRDSMNDFNFYMERAEIPVLAAEADITRLRKGTEASYLLIKERDLRRLKDLPRQSIIASATIGTTTWHLLAIKPERTN